MSVLKSVLLGAVIALAGCAQTSSTAEERSAPGGVAVPVTNVPVELRSADPKDKRLGQLIYRGGVSVVPGAHGDLFGGLSGFRITPDGSRFVAVIDDGRWMSGSLTYDAAGMLTGVGDVRVMPLLDNDGSPQQGKARGDAEGLTFLDPFDLKGDAFVSYEREHRIQRFAAVEGGSPLSGPAQDFAMPAAIAKLQSNSGLEAIASLGNGKLVAMAEEGPRGENDDSPGWVVDIATGEATSFTVKRNLPYALTDATLLPDGRLLVLSRRFSPLTGPGAELRLFDPAALTDGTVVEGQLVATMFGGVTVDNMEGVAARKAEDGKTLIYVVSDDNFQRPLQRTLVMMFELAE